MHVVSRFRAALAVAAALVTLVGCASGPGLDKSVSSRRTVPAKAQQVSDPTGSTRPSGTKGKPVDPAFAAEKLRLVDPCKLMSKDLLEEYGTPDTRASSSGYTRCSNYMKDKDGKDLNFSIELGYAMTFEATKADKQLGGLRSYEQKLDSGACFVSALTQENPAFGVRMQVGYKSGEPCEPGRKLLDTLLKKLKNNPPKYSLKKGTPIELDPCETPDAATIEQVAGGTAKSLVYGLHTCGWNTRTVNAVLDFRYQYLPKDNRFDDKQTEVDLGGIKGYQVLTDNSYPTCSLNVPLTKDGNNYGEIAVFDVSGSKDDRFDRCAKAQDFARGVLPKLPKA